jgi:hypothetical protein
VPVRLNLKVHTSPGVYQIPADLIKAEGRAIRSDIHKLITCVWNKEELPKLWKESVIFTYLYEQR